MIILFGHEDMAKGTFNRLQFWKSSYHRDHSCLVLFSSSYKSWWDRVENFGNSISGIQSRRNELK